MSTKGFDISSFIAMADKQAQTNNLLKRNTYGTYIAIHVYCKNNKLITLGSIKSRHSKYHQCSQKLIWRGFHPQISYKKSPPLPSRFSLHPAFKKLRNCRYFFYVWCTITLSWNHFISTVRGTLHHDIKWS